MCPNEKNERSQRIRVKMPSTVETPKKIPTSHGTIYTVCCCETVFSFLVSVCLGSFFLFFWGLFGAVFDTLEDPKKI